jgi:hypothetical protein
MVHVVRRVLGAFLVLAVVAGATLALSSRPRLATDRNAVERAWRGVQPFLNTRYVGVDTLALDIAAAGGPPNPITGEVDAAFATWKALTVSSPVALSISAANTLEGLARRLAATVAGSPLLKTDLTVTGAVARMASATIPPEVTPLNDAIAGYEKDRGGALRRLIAGPLGYSAIPRLALASGA